MRKSLQTVASDADLARLVLSGKLFSGQQYGYLNDVLRRSDLRDGPLPSGLFDFERLVVRYSLLDAVSEEEAASINGDVKQAILTAGLNPDGREDAGISGSQRMILDYDRLSLFDPGLDRFARLIASFVERYEEPMRVDPLCSAYLAHRLMHELTLSLFAAATRSGDYHIPHYHGNAVITVCYYVAIPDASNQRTGLAFGADDMAIRHIVEPKLYDVWIWPSYFVHWTSRQMSDDLRINVGIDYRPPSTSPEVRGSTKQHG